MHVLRGMYKTIVAEYCTVTQYYLVSLIFKHMLGYIDD